MAYATFKPALFDAILDQTAMLLYTWPHLKMTRGERVWLLVTLAVEALGALEPQARSRAHKELVDRSLSVNLQQSWYLTTRTLDRHAHKMTRERRALSHAFRDLLGQVEEVWQDQMAQSDASSPHGQAEPSTSCENEGKTPPPQSGESEPATRPETDTPEPAPSASPPPPEE